MNLEYDNLKKSIIYDIYISIVILLNYYGIVIYKNDYVYYYVYMCFIFAQIILIISIYKYCEKNYFNYN